MAGRDLSRRTGWARHDELVGASARVASLNSKFTRLAYRKDPDPPHRVTTGRDLQLASTVAGPRGQPHNYMVPQQINVRVAIRYRADWTIGKFGTVRRNRG
jgi:hypothetical protein